MAAIWALVSPRRGGGDDGDEEEREEDRRLGLDVASPLLQQQEDCDDAIREVAEGGDSEPLLGPVSPRRGHPWGDPSPTDGDEDGEADEVNSLGRESWEQLRIALPTSVTRTLVFAARISSLVFVGQLLPVEKLASASLANSLMVRTAPFRVTDSL